MKKKLILFLVLIVFLVGAVALSIKKPQKLTEITLTPTPALPVLKVGVPAGYYFDLLANAITQEKLDEKYGYRLEKKPVEVKGTQLALINKDVEVIFLSPIQVAQLDTQGKDLKVIAPGMKVTCPILVREKSNYKSIEDLKGKAIGVGPTTSGTYTFFSTIWNSKGGNSEKDFKLVTTPLETLPSALQNGSIEAMVGSTCALTTLSKIISKGGVKEIGSLEKMYTDTYEHSGDAILFGVTVRGEWLENNKELARSFVKSLDDAYAIVGVDGYYQKDDVLKSFDLTIDEAKIMETKGKEYNYYTFGNWDETISGLNNLIKDAATNGILSSAPQEEIFVNIH